MIMTEQTWTQHPENLTHQWQSEARWQGIQRTYSAADVLRLRPGIHVKHSLAERGANRLWQLLHSENYVNTMGAMTGAQATQMVKGGLKALYLSGWQVAADANLSAQTYSDQSLYPANSVPTVVKRINNALMRVDQIERVEGQSSTDKARRNGMRPLSRMLKRASEVRCMRLN